MAEIHSPEEYLLGKGFICEDNSMDNTLNKNAAGLEWCLIFHLWLIYLFLLCKGAFIYFVFLVN